MADAILAVDQGTSSTKTMLIDRSGVVVSSGSAEVGQQHPGRDWVEQRGDDIWRSVVEAVATCLRAAGDYSLAGVTLSVQRESVLIWDRSTGRAISPILSWQDQRTASRAEELEQAGHADYVQATTGLPLDPMFSALKMQWLLDEHDPQRERTSRGDWVVGTVDAWLLTCLTGAAVTEIGSASRTQLLDLDTGQWDPRLNALFEVPSAALPEVVRSTGPFGKVRGIEGIEGVPVLAVLADSHAALFAHAGWRPGVVKATYGTGSSVMALGPRVNASAGVCTTIAWQVEGIAHALEANIRSTGRTMIWLADLFGVEADYVWADAERTDSHGVVMVPAFGGLGAPHWDRDARPVLSGFTLGTTRAEVSRAAMESIAHQIDDVLFVMQDCIGPLRRLACDGGMTRSQALMQLQANLSGVPIHVSATANLSALGSAHLGGLVAGWWTYEDLEHGLGETRHDSSTSDLTPAWGRAEREQARTAWDLAVRRARYSAANRALEGLT